MQKVRSCEGKIKNYVLDTSVLIHNPNVIEELDVSNVFIPMEVLEELDNLKTRMDQVGGAARQVNRFLDKLREDGNILEGVQTRNGQIVRIVTFSDLSCLPVEVANNIDNKIISVGYRLAQKGMTVICLSNDISFRVKCDALGLKSMGYEKAGNIEKLFSGVETLDVSKSIVDELYEEGNVFVDCDTLMPNQGVLLRSESSSGLGIVCQDGSVDRLRYAGGKNFSVQGVKPRSKEQVFALEILLDPEVSLVTMTGKSGCGKTLLAIASALEMLHNNQYNKIVISRPVQSVSKDIGFLPGTKEEKMMPWLQPIFDNLEVIFTKKGISYFEMMINKGQIEVEALAHVRGRTLPNTIFIIDEAQNITHHEAKAVLTRLGENSKAILIGDLDQIDSVSITKHSSGLLSVVELFKDFKGSGHVSLVKGERSELATYAADVM